MLPGVSALEHITTSIVQGHEYLKLVQDLAGLLHSCIQAGASGLGWVWPFPLEDAVKYWSKMEEDVQSGSVLLFVAKCNNTLVGCVLLKPAWSPDAPNTAEVFKLLVCPKVRRGYACV